MSRGSWCSGATGRNGNESILGVLEHAPHFMTIGGEVSTQAFAITRLLLAFLHRALDGPADQHDWEQLWAADELPMDAIRAYADRVRHRFDLFDTVVPFFQVAGLRTAKGAVSGLGEDRRRCSRRRTAVHDPIGGQSGRDERGRGGAVARSCACV